jgi:hypothetical protein
VSNTEFEGGDDGHGHGDHTFCSNKPNPAIRQLAFALSGKCSRFKMVDLCGSSATSYEGPAHINTWVHAKMIGQLGIQYYERYEKVKGE